MCCLEAVAKSILYFVTLHQETDPVCSVAIAEEAVGDRVGGRNEHQRKEE